MIFGRNPWVAAVRRGAERPLGSGDAVDAAAAKSRLLALGADGERARSIDQSVDDVLVDLHGLSDLTMSLALTYLDRIARPLNVLDMESAVRLTTRGYAAHLVIEERGRELGVDEVPVLGDLPPMKRGVAPQGLLTRLVKVTRRDFASVRAVPAKTWDGLIVLTARRLHAARRRGDDGAFPPALDVSVIDALLRFGWVLRQVDLYYGLAPDRS